jgi:GH18 family chitinase/dienelactone hydrolase
MKRFTCLFAFVIPFLSARPASSGEPGRMTVPPVAFQAPRNNLAPDFQAAGVIPIFFDGLPWKGKPTRVFAWVGAPKLEPGKKAPGIVLVHGGGGTAFDTWVRLWVSRGYAAIAMDTCGCVPKGSYGKWQRHDAGGPPGWGGFNEVDEPIADQWPYHAVADVILAHSLLRSMAEVDADRIGITGISWGGYLTCIVSGLDNRFKFAAPVYGCGFLGDNSAWAPELKKLGAKGDRWLAMWDPSQYLKDGKMPKLWVTGTNDFAYPMNALQKSYREAGGVSTLCVRLRMPHGHGAVSENPAEIAAFADSIVANGKPLATIEQRERDGDQVSVRSSSETTIKQAELLYTEDEGEWQNRRWQTAPAAFDRATKIATATLPPKTKVYYMNLVDDRNLLVSTKHEELTPNDPAKVFVGYLFGHPRKINFKLYTHICHAFLVADEQGNVRKDRNVPSRDVTTQAHQAGVKVLLSLGGWGWDKQFAAIVSQPESEDRYVQAVIAIVKDYDYDGVDLDWEYPDTEKEVAGFERLVRRLRKQLNEIGTAKARPMLVTMAASSSAGTLKWLGKDFLLETMDWINVMTYDYTGGWTNFAGHHSPLFASSKQPGASRSTALTMKYLLEERGLPANRLAVGIPLYGRGFPVSEPYASTKDAPKTRVPGGGFKNLYVLEHEKGWTRTWDDETKNPWLTAPDHKAVIGYDDAESVAFKTEWAMKQGFRGVFFWEIGADLMPNDTNPLQQAARAKLDETQPKPK